jgi:hypothetical protein
MPKGPLVVLVAAASLGAYGCTMPPASGSTLAGSQAGMHPPASTRYSFIPDWTFEGKQLDRGADRSGSGELDRGRW